MLNCYDVIEKLKRYHQNSISKDQYDSISQQLESLQKKMDVDFIPEYQNVVSESVNNNNDNSYNAYVDELSKVFGKR
jgi:hypothetical protein